MTAQLSPTRIYKSWRNDGTVNANGTMYTYAAGTTTPQVTYVDSTQTAQNTNPIVFNARGEAAVWLDPTLTYKYIEYDSNGTFLGVTDNIDGALSPSGSIIPSVDNTYTLGSLSSAWANLYLGASHEPAYDPTTKIIGYYPRTAQEILVSVTPTYFGYPQGNVLRYGADLTGVADSTAAFNSAVKLGNVVVPTGSYKVTGAAVSTNDCTMGGGGAANTNITVGANNSVIFNVTAQRFKVSGINFIGDGTTSASNNGCAILLASAGEHVNIDCSYSGFGSGGISGTAGSSLKGPEIIRAKFRLTSALGNEINLGGIWTDTLIEDVDAQSTTADRVLLLYDNSTTGWQGLIVRGGVSNGYLKQQWATTDEHLDGTNRVWTAVFDSVRCIGSNWSGIKCKTSRNVKIVNCTFDGCGLAEEDQPSGLYGDVLCNSLGKVTIQGNTFRNSGSTAIKCNSTALSLYPIGNPGGQAEDLWLIANNQIDTTGVVFSAQGYGIALTNAWKGMIISDNNMRNLGNSAIINVGGATSTVFWDLGIFNNTILDSPASGTTIILSFGQSLRMNGNLIQNCGGTSVNISTIDYIDIGSEETVLDPAVGAGRGYQIGTFKDLNFRARAGNSTYTQWTITTAYTVGTRVFNGANVYECVVAGTSGAGAGPTATSGADTSDGTVTWYFVGKYQLMPYAIRVVGANNGRMNLDFDPTGCITGPIELLQTTASGSRIHYVTAGQTVNATVTNIAQVVPLPDLAAWMCEMRATACITGGPTDRACYNIVGLFYRNGGGVTLQGALTNVVTIESNAAWDAKPVVSANNLAPGQVTGAAATTINWVIDVTLLGIA
jgi:hypothetical protein